MPPETVQDPDKRPLPALWNYLTRVYSAMEDEAEDQRLADDSDEIGLVYEGHLTQLFQELGIPNPYYTSVTRALKAMQCIEQLRRGGGPSKSRWRLLAPPDEESFLAYESAGKTSVKHRGKLGQIEQRLRDLTTRQLQVEDEFRKLTKRVEALYGSEAVSASHPSTVADGGSRAQDVADAGRAS